MSSLEVSVRYWADCNNKCLFCFEKNYRHQFEPYILPSKESMLVHNKLLYNIVSEKQPDELVIMFMGGELFHKPHIQSLYEGFRDTAETLTKIQKDFGLLLTSEIDTKEDSIIITCNLLYDEPKLLYYTSNVMSNFNVRYMLSYDLWGRFSSNEKIEKYYNNLCNFASYNESQFAKFDINVILSAKALRIILNDKPCKELEYFKKIYELETQTNRLFISFQWPERIGESYSNIELYDFIQHLKAHYPRIYQRSMNTGIRNKPYSQNLRIIQGGKCYEDVGGLIFLEFNAECLSCENFANCSWARFMPANEKCLIKS